MPLFSRARTVTVADPFTPGQRYRLPVPNRRTAKRARRMASKEPGTVAWLHQQLRPGDVVWDVGANVGIYSLFAASRVGSGRVVAFEPHGPNFHLLLQAVALNGMAGQILPVNMALDSGTGYQPFHYHDLLPGGTGSQLASSPQQTAGTPVQELKHAVAADDLLAAGVLAAPDLIKIDVDGNEANILAGMQALLTGTTPPRSLQVEVDPDLLADVPALLAGWGWQESGRHHSSNVARQLARGADPAAFAVNLQFTRSDS